MVNFKAGAHQGEHKRALAAQGTAAAATAAPVSKEEKKALSLSAEAKKALLQRPWSNEDPLLRHVVNAAGMALLVVAREKLIDESNALLKAALVDQQTLRHFTFASGRADAASSVVGSSSGGSGFICRPGGDFVLTAQAHPAAGHGEVLLSEAQRLSLHVCEGEVYEWLPFELAQTPSLAELCVEAQLLQAPTEGTPPLAVDAERFGREVGKLLFGQLVTINELFIVEYNAGVSAAKLVLRVTELSGRFDDDDAAGQPEEPEELQAAGDDPDASSTAESLAAMAAAVETHYFRGAVGPSTTVFVSPSTVYKGSASQKAVSEGLRLEGVVVRHERQRRNSLLVNTSDGETFPVSRQLLRPCISLTSAIRDRSAEPVEVDIDVDCATFDRVLLFLEAAAQGRAESFAFDMATLEEVSRAAKRLGYRLLIECCQKKLGDFESRVRMHHWSELVRHNGGGGCWVTMDGMVFDLEAWLPQHPGGATIIPKQALNKDCTVFFELYHASRESFQYLREFYIGEVWPDERHLVPMEKEAASEEFMEQLQSFCSPFRISEEDVAKKGTNHLGSAPKQVPQ